MQWRDCLLCLAAICQFNFWNAMAGGSHNRITSIIRPTIHLLFPVPQLSAAVRSTLDRDTIGSTAVTELAQFLNLDNAALWLPGEGGSLAGDTGTAPGILELIFECRGRSQPMLSQVPTSDATVQQVGSQWPGISVQIYLTSIVCRCHLYTLEPF